MQANKARSIRSFLTWKAQTGILYDLSYDICVLLGATVALVVASSATNIAAIYAPTIQPVAHAVETLLLIAIFFLLGAAWGAGVALVLVNKAAKESGMRLSIDAKADHWTRMPSLSRGAINADRQNGKEDAASEPTEANMQSQVVWHYKFPMLCYASGVYVLVVALHATQLQPRVANLIILAVVLSGLGVWEKLRQKYTKSAIQ